MKREMKSNILKFIFILILIVSSGCTLFQKKSTTPTVDQVYSSILLDDSYRLNKYLIDGFPLEYEDSNGKNLLVIALENNSLKSIEVLLNKDIDKNKRDNSGKTPIFYVRSFEALSKLCEDKAVLNVFDSQGEPLLVYFLKNKPLSYSNYLITQNIDFELKDKNGWSALFWSGINGDAEIIREMSQRGANFLATDNQGNYPIYYVYDEKNLLELLNIKGYDLKKVNNNRENVLGEVYLRAVANGYTEVIKKLLGMGINPNYASYGDTAISIAKENKNLEMIKFLNSNGVR